MKTVLIALDYDPSAQKIAELGFDLAKSINAKVVLVHVIADFAYYSSMDYSPIMGFTGFGSLGGVQAEAVTELTKIAEDFLIKTRTHLGDENIQTVVTNGDFGDGIIDTATKLKADVIVLGTHSRSGINKILMGSVAEKVLHHSKVPLFIIPTKKSGD